MCGVFGTRRYLWLVGLVGWLSFSGIACTDPATPSKPTTKQDPQSPPDSPSTKASSEDAWWGAAYIRGAKVGYVHHRMESFEEEGETRWRFFYADEIAIKRFNQVTKMRTQSKSIEDAQGRLIRFESRIQSGASEMRSAGKVEKDQLILESSGAGPARTTRIPWRSDWGGLGAEIRSLKRKPLKAGETRRLKSLTPVLNQVGDVEMTAETIESVKLLTDTKSLLKVQVTVSVAGAKIQSWMWIDETGEVWKVKDKQLGAEIFRTDQKNAQGENAPPEFDLGRQFMVKVSRPLSNPHRTSEVVYLAKMKEGEIKGLFASSARQTVTIRDPQTAEIRVTAKLAADFKPEPPGKGDSEPSEMIQSDDQRVRELAQRVAPQTPISWALAQGLEKEVKSLVNLKNYSTAMASAAETARSREGDCTEHAMLLAAMCRARGIPARVAVGLVYYAAAQGFAHHMWTEVWDAEAQQWKTLDATLGRGGVAAAHLKFFDANLHQSNAYAQLLPVLETLGKLELEILSVK